MTTTEKELRVVGTRPIRHDGPDKVTGRAVFGPDFQIPGMLHGKVLRSPHAHARIRSIDTRQAQAYPGVYAVITGADFPLPSDREESLGSEGVINFRFLSNNMMAKEKALYKGHAVAAVAAVSPHVAEEALALIRVEYEPLPPVIRALDAMKPDAPLLHPGLTTKTMSDRSGKKTDTGVFSNVANYLQFKLGDEAQGFKQADLIVEREFSTATVHQGYIEPQAATALWNADDALTIWCSSQGSFNIRDQVAEVLQHPVSKVRVVPLEIGGGFGGKINGFLPAASALLSRKAGRPVRMVMTRSEVFEGTGPAPASTSTVKMGVTRQGRITAAHATLIYEAGAFPGAQVAAGATCMFSPYRIENLVIEGYDVVVNKPKVNAYRAPGAPMAAFAVESVVDEVCQKLEMDPLEFRLLNGAKEGDRRGDGVKHVKIGCLETAQAAREHPHYATPLQGPYRGRGVASGYWTNGGFQASCTISVNADGTASLVEGSPDIGGTRTTVAMQAAEVLCLRAEEVHPQVADTDTIGYTGVTGGSSTTFKTGWAAYEAAHDVLRQMRERAARIWEGKAEDVEFSEGLFRSKTDPELRMTFKELAGRLNSTGGPITGSANVNPRGAGPAFATHIVDVEVDPETGKVTILRYTAAQDVGKAVHPSYVEGQIQGGVAQGIGWALNEEYFFDEQGRMANASFLDYRMPTSLDVPMIEAVLVEVPNPGHPYGVRGVGEVSIVPPMAAIANAISRAVGVRLYHLPMNPGRVLEALWAKGDGKP
jgi:CO/xanthine dehydrogenase Mo-binding subunit